ncbi:dual specificity protein kinase yak1 [Coemansia sp. RSA 552]|nr:dual specificity protein kinase yak1 [Coemansia sp. RSA 552]
MDYTGSGNAPSTMRASYLYNGYRSQPRGDGRGATHTSASPMMEVQSAATVAARGSAGGRPVSMFSSMATSAAGADAVGSPASLAGAGQPYRQQQQPQQQYASTAPNTATSDRSFHAIMIGDSGQASARAGSSAHAPPDMQIRQKQSADASRSGSMADIYGGSLSSSMPSGGPRFPGEFSRQYDAAGPGQPHTQQPAGASQIVYPAVAPTTPGSSQAALQSPGIDSSSHARTASQAYAHQQQQSIPAQLQGLRMDNGVHASFGAQPPAAPGTLRSSTSNMSLSRPPGYEPAYQSLAVGNSAAPGPVNTSTAQMYPVSHPGLPPPGPAPASLSAYASGSVSPMVTRGRSRQRLYHGYDYPDAGTGTGGNFSPGLSPAAAPEAEPGARIQPPPAMRTAQSTNNAIDYARSAAAEGMVLKRKGSSEIHTSLNSIRGSVASSNNTPELSPSIAAQTTGVMASRMSTLATYTGANAYPEMMNVLATTSQQIPGREILTAGAAWTTRSRPESAMGDGSQQSDSGMVDVAVGSSERTSVSRGSPGDASPQQQEYASGPASMAHMRWNPTSGRSPLRQEINTATQNAGGGPPMLSISTSSTQGGGTPASVYATLSRAGYAARGSSSGSDAHGSAQDPPGSAGPHRQWPRISPQASNGGQSQSPAAGPVTDYYSLASPSEQVFNEPQTPRRDSTSLLPMVGADQGARAAPASNMDEINAHSQEYLHRRRRRLTQTLHNRQRSGSAADAAARVSTSRVSTAAMNMSSPSANSHVSNRSAEDPYLAQSQGAQPAPHQLLPQPLQHQQQHQPPPMALPGGGLPVGYIPADLNPSLQAETQAQINAQIQAQIQARAQAEYIQQLQLEQMEQERQRQEQARVKAAQEQEQLRFRNYRPLMNLTVDIVETYRRCHPEFMYESARRPRRVLTHPSEGVKNDGFDNENSDYILYVNDVIGEKEGHRYLILEMLGSGTFGQVVKCQNLTTGDLVAVKVIKNKTAYYNQSMVEVQMLDLLNKKYDVDDRHHILRLKEWFVFRKHLVFVNELLSINLYDLLKQNQYNGLSTNLVRVLVQQILDAMMVLNKAQIIHADLKPENILLEGMEKPVVKVIDFGSACFEWQTTFTYIQSRFYRSPEILLGLPYSSRIDMWSLGCIVAELYLGLPLFPGSSEYNQLSRIVDLLGVPPRNMLEKARKADEFFNYLGPGTWDLKSMVQYARERNTEEKESKRYFNATTLEELIRTYPIRRRMTDTERQREYQSRVALIDFLRGLLQLDPDRRWSPEQASMHPFITGEPFISPFVPPVIPGDPRDPNNAPGPYGGTHGYSGSTAAHNGASGGGGAGQHHTIGYSSSHYTGGTNSNGYPMHGQTFGSGVQNMPNQLPPPQQQQFASAHPSSLGNGGLTWAHHMSRGPQGADRPAIPIDTTSIPGTFPTGGSGNAGSGSGQSQQSLYSGTQALPHGGQGRARAATLSNIAGGPAPQGQLDNLAYNYAYPQQQQQQHQQIQQSRGFLDVDPSTSHTSDSLAANSGPRGVPGRFDISQTGSEYSADNSSGHGWASHSETQYNSNGPSSNAGSHGTRTGSLYEYTVAGPLTQRHYLVNERQQQRLAQQRRLYRSEYNSDVLGLGAAETRHDSFRSTPSNGAPAAAAAAAAASEGALSDTAACTTFSGFPAHGNSALRTKPSPALRSTAGMRLVSNFSPLTLSSTPGSSEYSRRYASSTNNDRYGLTSSTGAPRQFLDLNISNDEEASSASVSDSDNGENGDVSSSISSSDEIATGAGESSGRCSEESGMSRPLTQARGSEVSLSLYSAEESDDEAASHGESDSNPSELSDIDAVLHSSSIEGAEYPEAFESVPNMHSDDRWPMLARSTDISSHSSLPQAISHSLDETHGSIYMMPRYAAYSQSVLHDPASHYTLGHNDRDEAVVPGLGAGGRRAEPWRRAEDGRDSDRYSLRSDGDVGSVISQEELSDFKSPLSDRDFGDAADRLSRLDLSPSKAAVGTLADGGARRGVLFSRDDCYSTSSMDSGHGSLGSGSDTEDGSRASQDTVLFLGKLRPGQGGAGSRELSKAHGSRQATSFPQAASSSPLRLSPSPIPQGIRCAVAATHPQKIMKWSQQVRGDRSLQAKDNLRMVESLRRMGKWRSTEPAVAVTDEAGRAEKFFLDPVIVAMSPRLMPQPSPGGLPRINPQL